MSDKKTGQVIKAEGHFRLKAALDGASVNLGKIVSALQCAKAISKQDAHLHCGRLLDAFVAGDIKPFYCRLEDSDALYELMDVDHEQYGWIMNTTLKYANRNHCILTVALEGVMPGLVPIMVTDQSGVPIHSCLAHPTRDWLIDANGVHTRHDMLASYKVTMLGNDVYLKNTTISNLVSLGEVFQGDIDLALSEFGANAAYMLENREALAQVPNLDSAPDEDMEP